jgi:hypothetical protein
MTSITEEYKIQRLVNSILFGQEVVFILFTDQGHRLVAINGGQVTVEDHYPTLRGAKIAFSRYFSKARMTDEVSIKVNWTHTYPADPNWIKPYLDICRPEETSQNAGDGSADI